MSRFHIPIAIALLSLPAGAAFFYEGFKGHVYVINDVKYEVPRAYQRSVLGLLPEIGGIDSLEEDGRTLTMFFENEELRSRFGTYVSKYGERNFNALFSVMVFESDRLGTFSDEFLYFLPADGRGVEVSYDLTTGLYRYKLEGMDYKWFFGTKDPYSQGFNSLASDTFISCTIWEGDPIEGSVCEHYVKVGSIFFGFHLSYANLHLYQELQDFFFEKLESWRVE